MSKRVETTVHCGACAHAFVAAVADGAGVDREPAMLAEILAGSFNAFACPRCDEVVSVERQLLFTDFARGHFVGVFPPTDEARFVECGEIVEASFRRALVEDAPAWVKREAARFKLRVVFGLPELREKLLLWHNELDDRAIEILKIDLLADRPQLLERGVTALRVDGVTKEENAIALVSRPFPHDAAPAPVAFLVPRDTYDAVAAALPGLEGAHAALFRGPFVNAVRYLMAGAP